MDAAGTSLFPIIVPAVGDSVGIDEGGRLADSVTIGCGEGERLRDEDGLVEGDDLKNIDGTWDDEGL